MRLVFARLIALCVVASVLLLAACGEATFTPVAPTQTTDGSAIPAVTTAPADATTAPGVTPAATTFAALPTATALATTAPANTTFAASNTTAPATVAPVATTAPAKPTTAPATTAPAVTMPTSLKWTQLSGWGNARVTNMVTNPATPATIYVLTTTSTANNADFTAALYRTTDAGATWAKVADKVPGMVLGINVAAPGAILVSTGISGQSGLTRPTYRSTDGGKTFKPMTVEAVGSFVYVGKRVYATSDSGIYHSDDGGATWKEANVGIKEDNYSGVRALDIDPKNPANLYALVLYGEGGSSHIYKSTNEGASWTRLSLKDLSGANSIYVNPDDPRRLYIFDYAGFWKSTDSGATWTKYTAGLPTPPYGDGLAVDRKALGGLYTGAAGGFFVSSDGGQQWQKAGDLPVARSGLGIVPDMIVYAEPGGARVLYAHITDGTLWKAALS